ncbi:hypothetical protein O7606_23405 [Micromonospora sp. WMMD882]|uniref:hypothetical protein n=1 Tax=Micromonospora sp. WMMD882 TaxID=3015151 RepID=UPI00248C0413|nr:hypothetical protein [Micromonospora sp. WMMD882]WBB82523.1 hypothetical protein O7606_23405 [Micromonospora sp. WMMD882]
MPREDDSPRFREDDGSRSREDDSPRSREDASRRFREDGGSWSREGDSPRPGEDDDPWPRGSGGPWPREDGAPGRRSRSDRFRDDFRGDEPVGRRSRESRAREDVPAGWAPPPDAGAPGSRGFGDAESGRPVDPGSRGFADAGPRRPVDTGPSGFGAAGSAGSTEGRAAGYPSAGRRAYQPEAEPRPPYPVDETSRAAAGRPAFASSAAGPAAMPADQPTSLADVRATRPFRLRPEAAEADQPPPVEVPPGHHPDLTGTGPVPSSATSGADRAELPPPAPAPASASPYTARRSAPDPAPPAEPTVADRRPDGRPAVLPQRVPAEPDVPVVPEPPAVEPPAHTPELARIATHLRREDEPAPPQERPEGFDVDAILDAVRGVDGVRDASLRRTPAGAHSLRLDLADGADAAEVSRHVARLLQERMGLAAAPQHVPDPSAAPLRRRGGPPFESRVPDARTSDARTSAGQPPETRASAGRIPEGRAEVPSDVRRRRRPPGPAPRGRATVEEQPAAPGTPCPPPGGAATGSPVTLGTSYSGGQRTTTETAPSRPLDTGGVPGPRVVIDHVQVSTFGLDADVEVRLMAGGRDAAGQAVGPAVDGYVLRLCAVAAAAAVDELLRVAGAGRGRCFVEHAAVVPFGTCEVATVVVLLVCDGWVEQLAGSALVSGGDPRQAVVRATLAAVNRRLEALLR